MKNTIINAVLGLTTAYLLTIIFHEIAHYVAALMLGYDAELFHNRVTFQSQGIKLHDMIIAGIGPVFSLFQGVVAYSIAKKMRTSAHSLFVLWFGLTGLITFFGYMMIAPLVPIGDTGKVFHLLSIPIIPQVILAVLAVVLITIILSKSAKQFERYAQEDFGSIKENRKKWAMSMILFPLFISIVLITVLQFPIPHVVSIIATTCAPFSIMAVFGAFIGSKAPIARASQGTSLNNTLSTTLIILFLLSVAVNRLLVSGIRLPI